MSAVINTAPRDGWRNKHTDPMPTEACNMMVSHHEEGELVGRWFPRDHDSHPHYIDSPNILGRFVFVSHHFPHKRRTFWAWSVTNYEFTYYKIL